MLQYQLGQVEGEHRAGARVTLLLSGLERLHRCLEGPGPSLGSLSSRVVVLLVSSCRERIDRITMKLSRQPLCAIKSSRASCLWCWHPRRASKRHTTQVAVGRTPLVHTHDLYQSIASTFRAPIRYSVAYGSSVYAQPEHEFTQSGRPRGQLKPAPPPQVPKHDEDPNKMIDFLFGVTHPGHWHSLNLHQNPHHYAWLPRVLGSSAIDSVQQVPPGVWFNAFAEVNGRVCSDARAGVMLLGPNLLVFVIHSSSSTVSLVWTLLKPI